MGADANQGSGSSIERVGVVGAGTMGAGIALLACLAGFDTVLHDPVPEALHRGETKVLSGFAEGIRRGWWTAPEAEAAERRLDRAQTLAELGERELVIEAVPENLGLKQELFSDLGSVVSPSAVLATNTSSLPVSAIAAGAPNPERVVGMHFFNPPDRLKLVEIVATVVSAERALAETTTAATRMGRTPLRVKDGPGFLANRLARPFLLESLRQLEQGVADASTIDRVCRQGGGFRLGPFALLDLIGLDVNLSVARSFHAQGDKPERWRPSPIQERLVAEGHLGRKSGRGFYRYDGDRVVAKDRQAEVPGLRPPTLVPTELSRIDGRGPRILGRVYAQIANEAAFALEDEVASPDDMDLAMRLGFNWPLGALEIADLIGAAPAVQLLDELAEEHGAAYRVAPLLRRAAARAEPLRDQRP